VTTLFLLAVIALLGWKMNDRPEVIQTGSFYVIDGDTLAQAGKRFRLRDIDAPEFRQQCKRNGADWACGQVSRSALAGLVRSGATECRGSEHDRYGRLLVTCRTGDTDINEEMVRTGMAVSYGGYRAEEARARAAGAGVWAGDFERPQDFRRDERLQHGDDPLGGLGGIIEHALGWRR
jgi:endonuclease YncB( thermonuclease family)